MESPVLSLSQSKWMSEVATNLEPLYQFGRATKELAGGSWCQQRGQ